MSDPRHQKLAHVLVNYSLRLQPGDKFGIYAQPSAAPLVREVYRAALHVGAYPTVRITLGPYPGLDSLFDIHLRDGNDDQLRYVSDLDRQELEYFDARLTISAEENTRSLSGIAPERLAIVQQSRAPLSKRFVERGATGELRWCYTLFPTPAHAQDAGMALSDYEDFVFGAELLQEAEPAAAWRQVEQTQQRIADFLNQHDAIHIVTPDTDITYRASGRTWLNACGKRNFPDGEVFTGPIEDSVNGVVRFSFPAIWASQEVEDVRLTFRAGKVVEASATRGQAILQALLDQDPGARFVGEAAFGMNYHIQRFTRNLLFDEKIGGTMHIALGASYPETGGKNESGLHWDMLCDLRQGQVYADGQLCYVDGKFVI